MLRVPFNRVFQADKEIEYITEAVQAGKISGSGPFGLRTEAWLKERVGCEHALLTNSCTAALEIGGLLAEIGPGDEVIMPSFTFSSTANAFVLRGAVPVFIDIREDTQNIDETLIEAAITDRTKAICPVHYAGVGCEMDEIMRIADEHGLVVIEDAAQGLLANYKGQPLGTFGQSAALSFHQTKNIVAGEGGALLLNQADLLDRAEYIREKGTNRKRFVRGEVDKYTWTDLGSSYILSELNAALLLAQFGEAEAITADRLRVWNQYHEAFAAAEAAGSLRRPIVPPECDHNAHIYYLLLPDEARRDGLIEHLREDGVQAVTHYVPLHSAPAGLHYARTPEPLPVTDRIGDTLVRLPLWSGMRDEADLVIDSVLAFAEKTAPSLQNTTRRA